MPRSSAHSLRQPLRAAPRELAALLLYAAVAATIAAGAAASEGGGEVDVYIFPAFDTTTTDALVVATNSSLLVPASLLFRPERFYPELNRSEGFLLLSRAVDVWRAGDGGGARQPVGREASFNTSFTLRGAAPVAFAVLLDRFPPINAAIGLGLRGDASGSAGPNASSSLAAVEVVRPGRLERRAQRHRHARRRGAEPRRGRVDRVRRHRAPPVRVRRWRRRCQASQCPARETGCISTRCPGGQSKLLTSGAMYIPYCQCEMLLVLLVYLAHFYAHGGAIPTSQNAFSDPRTHPEVSSRSLNFKMYFQIIQIVTSGRSTIQTAFVGFFAASVSDIFFGVSEWDLTVDRFPRDGKKGTSWLVILLALLGSVAAATAIVSTVVCYFLSKRRRLNMEPKI